ncbi:MAG: hypothetical protein KDE59_26415 [Anaerolineales bacterium]|nr:hypothetical protein [Anaerolineales bacterium]
MNRLTLFAALVLTSVLFWLTACNSPTEPAVTNTATAGEIVATDPTAPTNAPATATPTQAPTATSEPAETATTREPGSQLPDFLAELELAVTTQDFPGMQALMHDPLAVGAWQSEWRQLTPAAAIEQMTSGGLPYPISVQFNQLSETEITALLGQPAESMFSPDVTIAAVLHTTGWEQSMSSEAFLYVAEVDGAYVWYGLLYTSGRFADAYLDRVPAPAGLIYLLFDEGIYQVNGAGETEQLWGAAPSMVWPRLAPDGAHAAYLDADGHLWLLTAGADEPEQLAADYTLAGLLEWGDSQTLFIGVWLDPSESEGPNNGHVALLDINSGLVTILDEDRLSGDRPDLAPDGQTVALNVFPSGPADTYTSLIYHPDTGLTVFNPDSFTLNGERISGGSFNPVWAPDGQRLAWLFSSGERVGLQIFDLEAQTVTQILDWDPARFGGLIPSPSWNPAGDWLAIEVLANGRDGSGIWLAAADGSSQILVDPAGHTPVWANDTQLLFQVNSYIHRYDLTTGTIVRLELPQGSGLLSLATAQ